MTYRELTAALKIFDLGDRATMKEIKARHREMVKRYHPDTGCAHDPSHIRKINLAYKVLLEYVTDYRFSFSEDEFYEQNPEERLRRQFMDEAYWRGDNS